MSTIGFDTGSFHRFLDGDNQVQAAWSRIERGSARGVISCVTLYELDRLGLRGSIEKWRADRLVRELSGLMEVVWLEKLELLRRAARLAHGHALSMADAMILASLESAGVSQILTTDRDLARYDGGVEIVLL